ncbi:aldose reductase-related protein 2-like [Aethina tumida]|uniref:aldose reductase-related protein 2-like n=1 Tax=Aethina tumida TaxID=116153 RepID=UPI00096B4B5D|nr:aldose reductase-related protein 2-like [Aethina tumida]
MASKASMELPGGYKMPAVGLGTWEAKDETELESALNAALEAGYRHIDTALVYENEVLIGKILKKWFDSGKIKREELFITTKLPVFGVRASSVEEYMKKSLENLGLEYVDLYLIHFPVCMKLNDGPLFEPNSKEPKTVETEVTDHIAVWKKMEEQVDAGRTRSIGLSNFTGQQIEKILKSNPKHKPANLQNEIHVYMQQQELVNYCHQNGITVTAYSPLGSPGINKFLVSLGLEPKEIPNMLSDETIKGIAKKHNKTNAQVMLRYLHQRNIIVIPKSVTPSRLKENIDIFDFELDAEDMAALNSLEVGPKARVCDWGVFPGLENNSEYPF